MGYTTQKVAFTPGVDNQGIDNFEFPYDKFHDDGFNCRRMTLTNKGAREEKLWEEISERLDEKLLDDFMQSFGEQTVVIDVQVGRGKTTACYKLIEMYCQQPDVTVLMLSPFRKLVDKDWNAIKAKKVSCFHYGELPNYSDSQTELLEIVEEAVLQQVHVMTVNCLLQNPGEDAFDANKAKKVYLSKLLDYCTKNNRKVIMFFDEVHESIYNFHQQFIPNLYRWREVTKLCFLSSATFNAASYPVIKYISLLTSRKITFISADRGRWEEDKVSRLHLHIVKDPYSGSFLHPLRHLKAILERSKEKQVNILTGTKAIANELMSEVDRKGRKNGFYPFLAPFKFKLITPASGESFQPEGNNIGTMFKTGVDIYNNAGKPSVYIIILPVPQRFSNENIFADGIPSIIQAIGRLRQSGDIHIFMHKPGHLIEPNYAHDYDHWYKLQHDDIDYDDNPDKFIRYRFLKQFDSLHERIKFPELLKGTIQVSFREQRHSLAIMEQAYENLLKKTSAEVKQLEQERGIEYRYHSFNSYLVENYHKLVRNYSQFGSDLSSYVLWAALNDQFCNARLESITYTGTPRVDVELDELNIATGIRSVLTEKIIATACKGGNLAEAIDILFIALKRHDDRSEIFFQLRDRKYKAASLRKFPKVMQAIVGICIHEYTNGKVDTLSKEDYILGSCIQVGNMDWEQLNMDIMHGYRELNYARIVYLDWLGVETVRNERGELLIHKDAYKHLPGELVTKALEISKLLHHNDGFISAKVYPFLRSTMALKSKDAVKRHIYTEFEKCFVNVGERLQYRNEQYYRLSGSLERVLPRVLKNIPLQLRVAK